MQTQFALSFLEAHWVTYGYIYLWCPGIETTDKTVFAVRYVSADLSFFAAPRRGEHCSPVCYGFAGTKIHNRRERIHPFRL